ncbi:MAG: hypothetical protein M0P30_05395 [Syntrophorhabdaceae bacterium]|nr:hypothetical protein [Syntrophorhabdaceae bacterium]
MKIKRDFVTNSSSTSFIMQFKSGANSKADFIYAYNEWRSEYIKKEGWKNEFQEPSLLTSDMVTAIGDGIFVITDFVPLYSGKEQDTPKYIRDLFDKTSIACVLLGKAGIALTSFDKKDFNDPERNL